MIKSVDILYDKQIPVVVCIYEIAEIVYALNLYIIPI